MEIEEERLEVEKRCIELSTQLEKAREENEKKAFTLTSRPRIVNGTMKYSVPEKIVKIGWTLFDLLQIQYLL